MKHYKIFITVLLFLILISSLSIVSAFNDTDCEILTDNLNEDIKLNNTNTIQENNTIEVTGDKLSDIQNAIDNVGYNSTIKIKGEFKDNGIININKSITLIGDNAVLRGENSIINISADNVILKGITFTNGCGIELTNTTSIISCNFMKNTLEKSMINAKLSKNTTINIINCVFDGNKVINSGIETYGGALSVYSKDDSDNRMNIVNSIFRNNCALYGSAIYIEIINNKLYTEITNSSFTKNTGYFGTVHVNNSISKNSLKIKDSFFSNNKLLTYKELKRDYYNWDAVEDSNSEISVYQTETPSKNLYINGERYITDKKYGPVLVYITDFEVDLENTVFTNSYDKYNEKFDLTYSNIFKNNKIKLNKCNFTNGSFLYTDYQLQTNISNSNLENINIEQILFNIGDYDEIDDFDSWMKNPGTLNMRFDVSNSTFKNSFLYLGESDIKNCKFYGCNIHGENVNYTKCDFTESSAVYLGINETLFDECQFYNNILLNGVVSYGSSKNYTGILLEPTNLSINVKIINSNFTNNYARYEGGAIYCDSKFISLLIENCSFINNTARNGGAIFAFAGIGEIKNCIFDNNHAINSDTFIKYPEDYFFETDLLEIRDQYSEINEYYDTALYDTNINSIVIKYFGDSYFGNLTINNNFWGKNIDNSNEFVNDNIIKNLGTQFIPTSWVNIEIKNNTLQFVTNTGENIPMPNYTVTLKNNEEKILASDIQLTKGKANININTSDSIKLISNTNNIINKKIANITLIQTGNYYNEKEIKITVFDEDNKAVENQNVLLKFSNGELILLKTDKIGVAIYKVLIDAGTYFVTANLESNEYKASNNLSNVTIDKLPVTANVKKLTTTFNSGKYMTIKVFEKLSKKAVNSMKLAIKVFTGKKSKTYYATTNEKGLIYFKPGTSVLKGLHKVEIASANKNYDLAKITTSIKINKAKTIIKAPKIISKYTKAKYFKITVKNKAIKKVISGIKLKVKVYTNKKFKTYTIKTNKKGVAQINLKTFKVGNHKVVISSGNSNYVVSAKSNIAIKR